ncbi:hypothetical protein JCM10212_003445 [Sporobolomyces blumeae]
MSRPPQAAGYTNLDRHDASSPSYNRPPGYLQQQQQQQMMMQAGRGGYRPPPGQQQGGGGGGGGPIQNPFYDGQARRERYDSGSSGSHHDTAQGVMTGQIGGGYGPYAYEGPNRGSGGPIMMHPAAAAGGGAGGAPPPGAAGGLLQNRYSARNSNLPSPFANLNQPPSSSGHSSSPTARLSSRNMAGTAAAGVATAPLIASSSSAGGGGGGPTRHAPVFTARDAELDDKLHNPSPSDKYVDHVSCTAFSLRGWLNVIAIVILVGGLLTLFAGYPIIQWAYSHQQSTYGAYNIGGINASGQVPNIPGLPSLIDKDTPSGALTRTGFDGEKYVLVFSDEFNVEGRTFWPGDDPFWEAVDLNYWATGDLEWYDPDAATTENGNLVITMTQEPIHDLNFRSAMLQSWNKFCFTGGYIEVNISLPGNNDIGGFWPGAWTMGNLGRAGYGATTHGTWPYSYSSCDVGTLDGQLTPDGTGPAGALNSGEKGGRLSYLPGQRLSACTCSGEDHPGPHHSVGRGAPEIDIIEAQVEWTGKKLVGAVSQSAQFAPFDYGYEIKNVTPYTVIHTPGVTTLNSYTGGVFQQACSGVTETPVDAYQLEGGGFSTYGWESFPGETDGFITWQTDGKPAWTLNAGAVGPNDKVDIGQRLISEEPMSIILNLGISSSFQTINYGQLKFPGKMLIDYVRVYQREGSENVGCDPPDYPTSDYINKHLNAYSNPNLTTWDAAGYTFPKNNLTGC